MKNKNGDGAVCFPPVYKKYGIQLALLGTFSILLYLPFAADWLGSGDSVIATNVYNTWQLHWEVFSCLRPGVAIVRFLRGFVCFTSAIALFCAVCAAAVGLLVAHLWGVRGKWAAIFVALPVVAAPYLPETISYYWSADAFLLGYLMAIISVWVSSHPWQTKRSTLLGCGTGAILLAASLSCYQAYLACAMVVCVGMLLFALLDKEKTLQNVLQLGGRLLGSGAAGVVLYWLGTLLLGLVSESHRFDTKTGVLSSLLGNIRNGYTALFRYLFTDTGIPTSWGGRRIVNALVVVCVLVCIAVLLWRVRARWRVIGVVGLVLLAPFAFGVVILLNGMLSFNTMYVPAMPLIYVLLAALLWRVWCEIPLQRAGKALWAVAALVSVLAAYQGIQYVNIYETCMQANLKAAQSAANLMAEEIWELADTDVPAIYVYGSIKDSLFATQYPEAYAAVSGSPVKGMFWDTPDRQNGWHYFFQTYCGMQFAKGDIDVVNLEASVDFQAMPLFPREGSMVKIGDTIVIKLGPTLAYDESLIF